MKIVVTLSNSGGELDRKEFVAEENDDVSAAIAEIIDNWVLSAGDTIKIVEE